MALHSTSQVPIRIHSLQNGRKSILRFNLSVGTRTSRKLASPSDRVFDDVAPTEPAVEALMYTLVDPMLSLSVPRSTGPRRKDDDSVAKQMHTVVLLYNYYYRKKKPELEFLDFVSFCKLAASRRYKLDASRDFPNLESCPISKVAVLVIDSELEHCLLRFGSDTQCVWSLIEKDLDNEASDDCKLLEIAFDAVKGITDIDRDDLEVLETHRTYSLLYGALWSESSMVAGRTTTDFVDYHEMLPYARFVSNWLSSFRKDLRCPSQNAATRTNTPNTVTQRLEVAKIIINSENEYKWL